ncbi:hypothetical protein [Komarekiella delphini-convector]|uniref:hypothetical protein n=1 Tax=Komarekiella delphini-convector TaxID=3050158 RepID=UPI001CD85F77|nr:hypothetical protein [Komarekiella delphini-convector]
MKLSDLSTETLEKIKLVRWDRIIEKHEGPESWESVLRYEQLSLGAIELWLI